MTNLLRLIYPRKDQTSIGLSTIMCRACIEYKIINILLHLIKLYDGLVAKVLEESIKLIIYMYI